MASDRFHKAAKDGIVDILKEATKRDCNMKDEDGMTPTLWAAFEGKLEALRLLVGRGGDPDRTDHFGNSALHLASAKGHMNCVTFLANFGANMWALDMDFHTPKEVAAIHDKEDILRFLDAATAKEETINKKHVKAQKDKAQKEAEKRLKEYGKVQKKADKYKEKEQKRLEREREKMGKQNEHFVNQQHTTLVPRPSVLMALKPKINTQPTASPRFSEIVGTVSAANGKKFGAVGVQRKVQQKFKMGTTRGVPQGAGDFKVVEIEDGRKSIRSLTGLRRDSEILYVSSFDKDEDEERGGGEGDKINEEEEYENQHGGDSGYGDDVLLQEPASIFDRPGFGSVAFRKSITATLSALPVCQDDLDGQKGDNLSIGSVGSLMKRQTIDSSVPWEAQDLESDEEDGEELSPIQLFLASNGLQDYTNKFLDEKIDLDAVMLLTDEDFKELGLPLGPRRKLTMAIENRKKILANPGKVEDSNL